VFQRSGQVLAGLQNFCTTVATALQALAHTIGELDDSDDSLVPLSRVRRRFDDDDDTEEPFTKRQRLDEEGALDDDITLNTLGPVSSSFSASLASLFSASLEFLLRCVVF
jgi:hypothetical protein